MVIEILRHRRLQSKLVFCTFRVTSLRGTHLCVSTPALVPGFFACVLERTGLMSRSDGLLAVDIVVLTSEWPSSSCTARMAALVQQSRLHSTLAYASHMQFESEWLARQVNA